MAPFCTFAAKHDAAMNLSTSLGPSGPTFSRIVFGVMKWGVWGHQLNAQQILALVEASIECGVTTFDHADIYGHYTTEADFGGALKLDPALRQQMQLVTKCGIKMVTPNRPDNKLKSYDTTTRYIIESAEQSLKNLHTDYLDLLLIHRPSPLMHPDEIAEAFTRLKQEGKVLHFGVSNFTPSQFDLVNSRIPLITNQIEASLFHLDPFLDGTLDQSLKHGLKPMAWSPLGGGKVFTDLEDPQVVRVREVAAALGMKYNDAGIDQILLAWLMQHPAGIIPVVGTGRIDRLKGAVEATEIKLTQEEWFALWEASMGEEVA